MASPKTAKALNRSLQIPGLDLRRSAQLSHRRGDLDLLVLCLQLELLGELLGAEDPLIAHIPANRDAINFGTFPCRPAGLIEL